jgi:hypothetical protein
VIESKLTGTFARERTRSVIITTDTKTAAKQVADFLQNGITGAIYLKEFKQSDLPDEVADMDEELLERHLKRAGDADDAVVCTKDGEPIYQFRVYMSDDQIAADPNEAVDVLVKHDNGDAIKAHRAAAATKAQSEGVQSAGAKKAGKGAALTQN